MEAEDSYIVTQRDAETMLLNNRNICDLLINANKKNCHVNLHIPNIMHYRVETEIRFNEIPHTYIRKK